MLGNLTPRFLWRCVRLIRIAIGDADPIRGTARAAGRKRPAVSFNNPGDKC
jgi:hypothetical protein